MEQTRAARRETEYQPTKQIELAGLRLWYNNEQMKREKTDRECS